MEGGGGDEGSGDQVMEEREEDMDELMQNPDFLRSVLSSLPGVNPEEALQNLEQMTEHDGEKNGEKKVSM